MGAIVSVTLAGLSSGSVDTPLDSRKCVWVSFYKIPMISQGDILRDLTLGRLSVCPSFGRRENKAIQWIKYDCCRGSHLKAIGEEVVSTLHHPEMQPPG